MKYYPICNFKEYPDMYVSRGLKRAVRNDGLIVPLLLISPTKIHPRSLERFEAFRRGAASFGDNGASNIIGVELSELSLEELIDEGLQQES